MSRPMHIVSISLVSVLALATGCTRDNPSNPTNQPQPPSSVGGGPTDPNNHTPCTTNADCGGGQICTTIGCCPGCHSDQDCAADSTCVAGSPNFCAPKKPSQPSPTVVDKNPPKPSNPNSFGPTPCLGDSDCPNGELCTAALCQVPCTAGSCATGQQCVAGRCYVGGATACGDSGQVLCINDAQCGSGRACQNGKCNAPCDKSADCGIGQACVNNFCADAAPQVAQCTFDTDCGTAFRCLNATCHALCGSDAQCGSKNYCDHGVCRANNRPAG